MTEGSQGAFRLVMYIIGRAYRPRGCLAWCRAACHLPTLGRPRLDTVSWSPPVGGPGGTLTSSSAGLSVAILMAATGLGTGAARILDFRGNVWGGINSMIVSAPRLGCEARTGACPSNTATRIHSDCQDHTQKGK